MDAQRVTYLLNFPGQLDHDRVLAWLRATSRTMASSRLFGSQSMAFETLATENGITHRLYVPKSRADDIIPQLRALVPGASATPIEQPPLKWTTAVEIGLKNKSLPLSIPSPMDTSTSILASLQPLRDGEAVLVQWVVTAAHHTSMPHKESQSNQFKYTNVVTPSKMSEDEYKERRSKLDEPNVMGVLRVAAKAKKDERAAQLIDRVRTSYKAVETPHNYWYKVLARSSQVLERVDRTASSTLWPAQLNMVELAALIGWPLGTPNVSGLPRGASRQLPALTSVPREGLVFGISNFPGDERPIAVDIEHSCQHLWVIGPTGVGKSTLLTNTARQIMDAGLGMLLIETKHDLFDRVLNQVPYSRLDDMIVMDINDTNYPVGWNVLDESPEHVLEDLENIMASIHGDDKNVWLKEVMYHAIRTLRTRPGATIVDLPALLSPRFDEVEWQDQFIRSLTDPELLNWWQRRANEGRARQDQFYAPVLSRFWNFNTREPVRNMFGQRTSTFSVSDVVQSGKVLLVNITGIDPTTQKIIGSMLVNAVWREVLKDRPEKPFYFMADEAQNMMHLPINMDDLLSQARSRNLSIIMANQNIDQLPENIRMAAEANARTKIVFQLEHKDARHITQTFGTMVNEGDFLNLPIHECIARISTAQGVSAPVTFRASEPMRERGLANAARSASRKTYGRPASEVEAEIRSWRQVPPEEKKKRRPTISGADWNT